MITKVKLLFKVKGEKNLMLSLVCTTHHPDFLFWAGGILRRTGYECGGQGHMHTELEAMGQERHGVVFQAAALDFP